MPFTNLTCADAFDLGTLPFGPLTGVDTTGLPASSEQSDYDGSCGDGSGSSFNAIWYKYTLPAGQTSLRTTLTDPNFNLTLTLVKGSCGSLSWADCFAGFGSPSGHTDTFTGLTPGDTWYFMFTSYEDDGVDNATILIERDNPTGQFCDDLSCAPTPTPMPNPTPAGPQTDCAPQTQVKGGGTGNAGCTTGGVGWTSSYSGPYGVVPVHANPAEGETLKDKTQLDVWIELDHDGTTHRRSFKEMGDLSAFYGGRKTEGLKAIGDVEHGMSNEQGGLEAASVDIQYADQVDRLFRDLLETEDLENDDVRILAASPEVRTASGTAHTLMRATVTSPITESSMNASITAVDALFAEYGPFGPNAKYPFYKFKDLGDGAPNCPSDVLNTPIPILYGEKSDEGAEDPITGDPTNPKGLCPGYYIGMFTLPGDIITVTPTPGRPFADLVAALSASAATSSLVADFGSGGTNEFGDTDLGFLQDLYDANGGHIPDYLTGLAAGVGVDSMGTGYNGLGYSDIEAWQGSGTTTHSPDQWAFIAFFGRPPYRYIKVYGSDLGGGNPDKKHDRAEITNLAGREDLLCPGYNWPFTDLFTTFINTDTGRTFWLSGIWVRGPILDDHLSGTVNITANCIGNEDVGDGSGLPLIAAHDCEQDWLDNFILPETPWTNGALADATNCPKWNDGTCKVRSTSFAARQAFLASIDDLSPYGLTIGWYANEQKSIPDWIREWNYSTESKLMINHQGQIDLWGFDPDVDITTFSKVTHVTDLFGRIRRTSGEERENVVSGSCDWDPDAQKYRTKPITRRSTAGITSYKNHEKENDQLDSTILNDEDQMTWVLEQRVLRLAVGITLYDVDGVIGLLDNKIGNGVLLTTIEGTGTSGFVDRPMIVTRSRYRFNNRITTLTLWDISYLL